ncbi:hypothetical protein GOBAR_AA20676 [Gossypium barbadense]|uniref:PB1 domain-containing protein n=1 Tax=Gossypium barbadense TaxID=3634 RepID=A0A2P5X9G7_GOSBA|nr:hypothetical protein GOBAR_AA20676 [Gossypium barbadense]
MKKLQKGLKFKPGHSNLDDEKEWVILISDSELQECLEVMEYVGTHSVKFQVLDVPCAIGSSGGSNCFLWGANSRYADAENTITGLHNGSLNSLQLLVLTRENVII